jgi:ribonuclease G
LTINHANLIISVRPGETRVALVEQQQLAELIVEKTSERSIVGNIYKGKILRVLPGMQAAFVDIGIGRAAFLYAGDVLTNTSYQDTNQGKKKKKSGSEIEPIIVDDFDLPRQMSKIPIAKSLQAGQEVLVQVAKEPLGTKGARVTMHLSLPGRYLVFLPQYNRIAISKKINSDEERQRLLGLISSLELQSTGLIIRTAAQNADASHFIKDLDFLQRTWKKIELKLERAKAPSLLHQDLILAEKTTRDLYSDQISRILVDDAILFRRLKGFLRATIPGASSKIELYESKDLALFDFFGLETEIERAMSRRVDLPSGGYLIFDQTEALTCIDVNTGRFVGKKNAEDTIFKTNLEAIKKIVAQVRLRNLGGIIIADLIDMEKSEHRERIQQALTEELKQDRSRVTTFEINALGLIQMTRKRTRESLEGHYMEDCPMCEGRGAIKTTSSLAHDVLKEIERYAFQTKESRIMVKARSDVIDWILEEESVWLEQLMHNYGLQIEFSTNLFTLELAQERFYEVFSAI